MNGAISRFQQIVGHHHHCTDGECDGCFLVALVYRLADYRAAAILVIEEAEARPAEHPYRNAASTSALRHAVAWWE